MCRERRFDRVFVDVVGMVGVAVGHQHDLLVQLFQRAREVGV